MRGKAFLKCKSIDLSSKLSVTYGGNINYYKNVHHPIPTLPRVHPGNFQNKSVNSPFTWISRYILFLPKLKRKEKTFFERVQEKVSFCEIWNNPTLPLFFIRPPYKKALQDMEFYDKLVDWYQDLSKLKNPAVSKAKVW